MVVDYLTVGGQLIRLKQMSSLSSDLSFFFSVCRQELFDRFLSFFGVCHCLPVMVATAQLREGRSLPKSIRNKWRCILCVCRLTSYLETGQQFVPDTNKELLMCQRSTWRLAMRPSWSFQLKVQSCTKRNCSPSVLLPVLVQYLLQLVCAKF